AIMSNDYRDYPADAPPRMLEFAAKYGFTFPYLVDEDQSVGKAYGAVCTPDFFGFDGKGTLQYRGRLDDARMGDATNRTPELLNAMRMIAETGQGPDQQEPSMGCSIKWS
ncbi:MAG: redoxin domain-containing protein, partial [Pseudomonadota bacterium]